MSDDERNDLRELKAFLERAIPQVEDDLILTDPKLSPKNYKFLIDKARMYRNNLNQINALLENS